MTVATRRRHRAVRQGLSVIEVLTAIVVALIGLAGVLVMIPFAVSQSEIGMDTETAVLHARNLTQEMEIRGMQELVPVAGNSAVSVPMSGATSRCYCFDPIGVAARFSTARAEGVVGDSGLFPFVSSVPGADAQSLIADGVVLAAADQSLFVQRVSTSDPLSLNPPAPGVPRVEPMRMALANSFRWQDDFQTRVMSEAEFSNPLLNVGNKYPARELGMPMPRYNQVVQNGTGTVYNSARQSLGEMSLVMLSCPGIVTPALRTQPAPPPTIVPGAPTNQYPVGPPANVLTGPNQPDLDAADAVFEVRNFYLVYKRRLNPVFSTDPTLTRHPYDRCYRVDWPGMNVDNFTQTVVDPFFRVSSNGGTFKLRAGGALAASNNSSSVPQTEVRRGDWMALTNVIFDYDSSRFVRNINFYQVVDAFLGTDSLGPHWMVTVKGPDWDFLYAYRRNPSNGAVVPLPPPMSTNPGNYTHGQATLDWMGVSPFRNWRAQVVPMSVTEAEYRPSITMAIHLPDVWTVFERTTRLGD